ncbi:hypothetical protein GH714_030889 [Hevea brasiliensis]|uniref:SPX domain-containing protein n=1 Tax=Hevea brasiliensis TaxID=3981 RepID=A0A6A6LFW0_HEVBR|nr:hypothetical protein GH714_030889 [Hevea brasiliensis]
MKFGKEFKKQKVPEWTEAYMDYNGLKRILREILQYKQSRQPSTPLRSLHHRLTMHRAFSGLELPQSTEFPSKGDIEDQVIDVSTSLEDGCRKFYKTEFLRKSEEGGDIEVMFFKKLDEELNKVNSFYKDKVEEMVHEASLLNRQMDVLIALRIRLQKHDFEGANAEASCSNDIAAANHPLRDINLGQRAGRGCMESTLREDTSNDSDPESTSNPDANEVHTANCDSACKEEENDRERDPLKILEYVKLNNTLESPLSTIRGVFKDSTDEDLSFNKEELRKVEERLRVVFIEFYHKLRLLKHYSYMNLAAFSKIMKKYEKFTSRRASRSYMKIVDNSYLGSSDEVSGLLERVEATFIKHFSNSNRREVYLDIVLHKLMYVTNIYFWRRYRVNYPFIFGFKQGTELGHREVFMLSNGLALLVLASCLANLHLDSGSNASKYKTITEMVPLGLVAVVLVILFCPLTSYTALVVFLIRCFFRCCAPLYKVTLPDFFLADPCQSGPGHQKFELYICTMAWGNTLGDKANVIIMVLNVLLRLAWMQLVLEFNLPSHHKIAASTVIACLEIIRRGIWSFFRLENEHLNNVGKFRAFKSVPLPFNYYDADADKYD